MHPQERESYIAPEPCRLLERSIFCDRMVFVRACHAAKFMNDTELSIYDAWFDPVLNTLPTLVPNGFVYLRAQPEVCHQRLKRRARQEETTVQLEYLQELHQCHEDWLFHGGDAVTTTSSAQLYIWVGPAEQVLRGTDRANPPPNSAAPSAPSSPSNPKISYAIRNHLPGPELTDVVALQVPKVPRRLSGAIRFIDANRAHIHPLLDTIPSLVLDCNNEVDVEHDEQYKAFVSSMVEEFSEYVRAYVLARGDARLALGEHLASKAEAQKKADVVGAGAASGAAPAEPVAVTLPSNFDGYSMDVRGTTLYVEPEAPLLAHAASRASQKRGRKGRMYFPSTPRTPQQQQRGEAQRAQQEDRDADEEDEVEEEVEEVVRGPQAQQQQQQQQQQQEQGRPEDEAVAGR
ncbi:Deoxynucleoside kinase-domain-containing protein [Dunaliella salina]|uniref:Deoxynucleoside kinase-domain-containing protein n=1 Tax=Dunaliella salina TaxID=3046 RepID=A0ABQ7HAM6_DUNSA|nr:Deoxynucleoside kinase-domain-containing protein [Dunaliella salina]|eukprot:KAF5843905.1 Deoxynucleoside kinase-domain-containing protein [Dunaliella salina]